MIANNIANINTTGFKRSRAEFTDLLYQTERAAGTPNRGGQEAIPEGAQIGLGVRTTAIRNLHQQGALAQTGNKLAPSFYLMFAAVISLVALNCARRLGSK